MPTEEKIGLSLIIPAYNEKDRLPVYFHSLIAVLKQLPCKAEVLIVDDRSRFADQEVYRSLANEEKDWVKVLSFEENRGKGAAIKAGFQQAQGEWVGFVDADGATSAEEVFRLINVAIHSPRDGGRRLGDTKLDAVFGSRIKLLGRAISRSPVRHATGRIFATLTARLFNIPVYDSQCGCKFFWKKSFIPVFEESTETGWLIDVELIALAYRKGLKMLEVPVSWHDVSGSKINLFSDGITMITGLFRLAQRLKK